MQEPIQKKRAGRSGAAEGPYKRTHRLSLWVTDQELTRIKTNAAAADYPSIAQYLRQQAISQSSAENPASIRSGLLLCHYQIQKLGVNINQIAKWLNQDNKVDEMIFVVLKEIQQEAERMVAEVMKESGGLQ